MRYPYLIADQFSANVLLVLFTVVYDADPNFTL